MSRLSCGSDLLGHPSTSRQYSFSRIWYILLEPSGNPLELRYFPKDSTCTITHTYLKLCYSIYISNTTTCSTKRLFHPPKTLLSQSWTAYGKHLSEPLDGSLRLCQIPHVYLKFIRAFACSSKVLMFKAFVSMSACCSSLLTQTMRTNPSSTASRTMWCLTSM